MKFVFFQKKDAKGDGSVWHHFVSNLKMLPNGTVPNGSILKIMPNGTVPFGRILLFLWVKSFFCRIWVGI